MRRIVFAFACIILLSFACFSSAKAAPTFPAPTGFVVDQANIIDDTTEARITARLSALEATSTSEIAVATVSSLEDLTIEEYALELFEYWKVGKAKQDNGVLLLIAPNEREVRIEVGYGLEGALTDIESSQIIDNILIPAFKEGDFSAGIDQATEAVVQAVEGEYSSISPSTGSDPVGAVMGILILSVVGFIAWAIVSQILFAMSRTKSFVAGGVVGAGLGSLMGLIVQSVFIGALLGGIFGAFLDWALSRLPQFKKFRDKAEQESKNSKNRPGGRGPWGGFGGSSGSGRSSGGFGGFGGGSSGGGGASGRW